MTWRLPDTYHSAGTRQGTATLKFYEGRDILPGVGVWVFYVQPLPGALVSAYLPAVVPATPGSAVLPAGMVAVPAAGLSAVPSGAVPAAGTLMVFCHPVVTAPAVVRRDGAVLAGGWLPDFVRLGELERHLGEGVIAAVAAKAPERGLVRVPQRKRIMSGPLTIRLVLAMSLMPDASYGEALARLAGLVARVPFARLWHVPTEKVVTHWRRGVAPSVLEELFWAAAGPLVSNDGPGAVLLAGMPVNRADGMLVALADTPANRKAFGCAGTSARHGAGARRAPWPPPFSITRPRPPAPYGTRTWHGGARQRRASRSAVIAAALRHCRWFLPVRCS
jgi:Insertion element 4 transposase N-terminal